MNSIYCSKQKNKFCSIQNISDLFLGDYHYKDLFVSPKGDEKIPSMPLIICSILILKIS